MHCFPEMGWDLRLNSNDPPDLIDDIQGVGIEVTSVNIDAESAFLFEKYINCEKDEIPQKAIQRVESFGGQFIYSEKEKLAGCFFGVRQLNYKQVVEAVIKKTKRLNSGNYDCFAIDGLFIDDSDSFLFEKGIPDILDCIEEETNCYTRRFSIVFVFCHHDIFMIDAVNRIVKRKPISDEEIEQIRGKTLRSLGRICEGTIFRE